MDATEIITGHRVVPVVVINDVQKALKLSELFLEADLRCVEVTLRSEHALECIEAIATTFSEITLGAGSVVTPNQLQSTANAGAQFAVSPGSSDELLSAAQTSPLVPGAATASEIMQLRAAGYRTVKFFPAELLGGVKTIRSLSEPISDMQFFPTGGIRETNLPDYLDVDNIVCVGGSWLAPKSDVENGEWQAIQERCLSLQRILATTTPAPPGLPTS